MVGMVQAAFIGCVSRSSPARRYVTREWYGPCCGPVGSPPRPTLMWVPPPPLSRPCCACPACVYRCVHT